MRPLCAVALLLAGCGGASEGARLPLDLVMSRAIADQLSAFQIALVSEGTSLSCEEVIKDCLGNQLSASRLVPTQDAAGREHRAISFPVSLTPPSSGSVNTQDVQLRGIPVGKDYAVVIEALSKDSPPRLVGSSCNYVPVIRAGLNDPPLTAQTIRPFATPLSCDPTRFDL